MADPKATAKKFYELLRDLPDYVETLEIDSQFRRVESAIDHIYNQVMKHLPGLLGSFDVIIDQVVDDARHSKWGRLCVRARSQHALLLGGLQNLDHFTGDYFLTQSLLLDAQVTLADIFRDARALSKEAGEVRKAEYDDQIHEVLREMGVEV